jgi:hypothetical protein
MPRGGALDLLSSIQAKVKKHRAKKPPYVPAITVGFARITPINLRSTKGAELQEICARIPCATKIQILFSYPSIVRYSLEEENRQSEKLHSTLSVSRQSGVSELAHCRG